MITQRDAIIEHLNRVVPQEQIAKVITREINRKHPSLKAKASTVKRTLARLYREGLIDKGHYPDGTEKRGLYRSLNVVEVKGVPLLFPDIHGLKVEHRCPQMKGGVTCGCNREGTPSPDKHRHKRNKSITMTITWKDRPVTITYHKSLIEAFLNATDDPIDIHEFIQYCGFIEGKFNKPLTSWYVVQIGLAKDLLTLELDGFKGSRMRLDKFKNMYLEFYQKTKDKVRVGVHFNLSSKPTVKRKITVEDMLEIFQNLIRSIESPEVEVTK